MATLSRQDLEHLVERLRSGAVPERGLDALAVGVEAHRRELARLLDMAAQGEGLFKFLRGGYGCGKTFMTRLALLDARARGFATSFVVVSDNDLHFHRFDELYRKVVQGLTTASCTGGALGDLIDRWIGKVEEALIDGGADEDDPSFDAQVAHRLGSDLALMTRDQAPQDMVRVLQTIFRLKQDGKLIEAGSLISWLSGSQNVASSAKKAAGIKGDITGADALAYLHGILEIVKAAGSPGLVIAIDEAETILRMRRDVRSRSLNGIRQICDDAPGYHGLLWLFTGTPDLFDTRRGVAGLEPLHQRIRFISHGKHVSLRQSQLALEPFDTDRLLEVALKLRELYPARDRALFERKVTPELIHGLVDHISSGFRGDVGVVPRQLLRELINLLDLVDEDPNLEPASELGFKPKDLNEDEQRALDGRPPYDAEPEDEQGYEAAVVTF